MDPSLAPPIVEFAFPGPVRDRLVALICAGEKTSTTSTLHDYERDGEPLPRVGAQQSVVDSQNTSVAVIEITAVTVVRIAEVTIDHVLAEGEGHTSIESWRSDHEKFWLSTAAGTQTHASELPVTDDTLVVLEEFRLISPVTSLSTELGETR